MTKTDTEIMQYIAKAAKDCRALYEVPMMVYAAIMHDNATRKKSLRAGEQRIKRIMHEMAAANLI